MSNPASSSIGIQVHLDDAEDLPRLSGISLNAVRELAAHTLESEKVVSGEVDIVFCGDDRIAELNREWLDREGPTDCIAFDLREEKVSTLAEGELYIDLSQAERQAPDFGVTLDEELRRLVIHGLLHLLGYTDTGSPAEADLMKERQESLVSAWSMPVLEETE
ncbi:rRNA maturation RNase YbeY [Candidatus Zixiibacteriota bacterium]